MPLGRRRGDQLATKTAATDAGNPDRQGLERCGTGQKAKIDEVAGFQPANSHSQLDVINTLLAPELLDVLDVHGVGHDGPFAKAKLTVVFSPAAAERVGRGGRQVKIIQVIARQDGHKGCSLPCARVHRQRPSALFHQQFDDSEADAQTGGPGRGRPIEQIEHLLIITRRQTDAVVGQPKLVGLRRQSSHADPHPG